MASNNQDNPRKELGDKLKKYREQAGLTQIQVAEAAELNANYYARIERGEENPSFEKLQKIMKALGVKSFDLL